MDNPTSAALILPLLITPNTAVSPVINPATKFMRTPSQLEEEI